MSGADRDFRVIALIAAYNEADILGKVIEHLIEQGVFVYLLDDGSTDETTAVAEPFLNRGLLGIEQLPGRVVDGQRLFEWKKVLARKQELSHELEADWFIHHDADEFRESPWLGVSLAEGIQIVDRLGYNAIDFELLNFVPTDESFRPGDDPRRVFRYYEPGKAFDRAQVKCWKKQPAPVDLLSIGGHYVGFPDQRVFPLRFVLRHYPIRDQAHGARKVFVDRLPRFAPDERAVGWHVQYNEVTPEDSFLRDPATLTEFDAQHTRIAISINNRHVEELEAQLSDSRTQVASLQQGLTTSERRVGELAAEVSNQQHRVACLERELEARSGEVSRLTSETATLTNEVARLTGEIDAAVQESQRQAAELTALQSRFTHRERDLELTIQQQRQEIQTAQNHIASLYASKSWRWMAPLRALYRLLSRAER